ncbi:uncharacterized protein N7506_005667 [Penicillium brevicompactum]|uniref:uncharacterized protein n=1 Tax=Penicillium brevicompactum TaxID=5074 RepID=UPI002541EFAD|nr:uncharacterized protein N7506_005667 [Penicillium brevicompactum]KAJ5335731.1 hypothetical protein N7506_005667 [Penicillium brevicompactum]
MACEKEEESILRILLQDLEHLEHNQKGKQREGEFSDLAIALNCMKDDCLAEQTSIEDGIMALSISTAVATDQNELASIKCEETIAEYDHQLALALEKGDSNDDDVADVSNLCDRALREVNEDPLSTVIGDLMGRMDLSSKSLDDESSSSFSSSHKGPSMKQCVSCLENFDTTVTVRPCAHEFCRECMRQLFLGATKDEELYPPRCCGNVVPPGLALRLLSYKELRDFSESALEWTAKDRLYCAEPSCSKFIPPFAIRNEFGTCTRCHRQTHVHCRSFAHPGIDCPMDDALHDVLQIADTENWQRCFNCRAMVELQHGCNHITCR